LVLKWMLSFEEEKVKAHFICQEDLWRPAPS
jgi:hypothetical protein